MTLKFCNHCAKNLKIDKTLGYVYFIDKNHPLAHPKNGKVYYHRHIASVANGRWIDKHEVVHHKDNDRKNNDPLNLEILTHPEHSKHHISERIKEFRIKNGIDPHLVVLIKKCLVCGNETKNQKYCSDSCRIISSQRAKRPTKDELSKLLDKYSCVKVSKMYGVSDVAIKKWATSMGLTTKPRGFWAKHDSVAGAFF